MTAPGCSGGTVEVVAAGSQDAMFGSYACGIK
jgi:hypothetical protein